MGTAELAMAKFGARNIRYSATPFIEKVLEAPSKGSARNCEPGRG
jgi:hypothetical protein